MTGLRRSNVRYRDGRAGPDLRGDAGPVTPLLAVPGTATQRGRAPGRGPPLLIKNVAGYPLTTILVEGTHSHLVELIVTGDVPNWFSSHTSGMIGVGLTG
jgi:hypothetical protein